MKTVAGLDLCFAVVPFLSRGHVIENSHLNFNSTVVMQLPCNEQVVGPNPT